MKNLVLLSFLITFLAGFSQQPGKTEFLHTLDKKITDRNGENILLRGIGLGGHMLQEGYMLKVPFSGQQYVIKGHIRELIGEEKTAEFYNAWLNNHTRKSDIDSLKNWGFNSVRLPMHYNLFTLAVEDEPVKGVDTWLEKGFQMTDSLLSWCKANEMYLILDMHAAPGGQGHDVNISDRNPNKPSLWESEENKQKLVALWKKIAERYKDETWIGAYDIINEPNWTFEEASLGQDGTAKNGVHDTENKPLRELMIRITSAIREVDKNHIIIIEGNGWGNNYNGILPPWDDNMVLSFHKYWNYNKVNEIQKYLDYREQYNIPIWLGESGENSNAWFTEAIGLMEENNIGWCWWPLKKLGSNNPAEIKINSGYRGILEYWSGKAEKPSEEEAYKAFMQLAENIKIENCIIHYGVIDAMMVQPHTETTRAYKEVNVLNGTIIPSVHYDKGRNGKAYMDTEYGNYYISTGGERQAWNNGRHFRNDGVDIFGEDEKLFIGNIETGEWLKYTFNIVNGDTYTLSFQISSENNLGKASVEINGINMGEISIPGTNGEWKWVPLENIILKEGENKLVIKIENGGFNFQSFRFSRNN